MVTGREDAENIAFKKAGTVRPGVRFCRIPVQPCRELGSSH